MELQALDTGAAVVALVVGTVLVLCIPAALLSTDLVDRVRSVLKR